MEKIKKLAKKIEIEFDNIELLQEAMTHRSYLNEHKDYKFDQNERMEFLGDAVLELIVTEHLYLNYGNPEGELTNWRASLVKGEMLAFVGDEIGIEKYLLMSKGEKRDTGKARQYILANAMEAIIGAIYLDKSQGYDSAKRFIEKWIIVKLPEILKTKSYLDPKSYFQEKAQEFEQTTPHYEVLEEWGPDHEKIFLMGVFLGDEKVAEGKGDSKQEAQRTAAEKGLEAKNWK
ncbi:ribonuclease III [bacterium]|jgi:ribonuclease III|nr:ribonuclease III [bacterium]MBT4251202.1 ribonuclease III [bacterium]MBT4598006.1 ribonuclease III [bacterium]MBT6753581.1 ribonuclease III [bacterium]MBT7037696.1 ribonuclease III [bacterium]